MPAAHWASDIITLSSLLPECIAVPFFIESKWWGSPVKPSSTFVVTAGEMRKKIDGGKSDERRLKETRCDSYSEKLLLMDVAASPHCIYYHYTHTPPHTHTNTHTWVPSLSERWICVGGWEEMELGLRRGNELTTVLNHLPPAPPLTLSLSFCLSHPPYLSPSPACDIWTECRNLRIRSWSSLLKRTSLSSLWLIGIEQDFWGSAAKREQGWNSVSQHVCRGIIGNGLGLNGHNV